MKYYFKLDCSPTSPSKIDRLFVSLFVFVNEVDDVNEVNEVNGVDEVDEEEPQKSLPL